MPSAPPEVVSKVNEYLEMPNAESATFWGHYVPPYAPPGPFRTHAAVPTAPMPQGPPHITHAQRFAPSNAFHPMSQSHDVQPGISSFGYDASNFQGNNPGYVPEWDPWGNYRGGGFQGARPVWRINRKETEGLFKFDGELANYRAWKSRVRDHASESWPEWREILDHAEATNDDLSLDRLATLDLYGVNGKVLANDLWSFLLKWIGPLCSYAVPEWGPPLKATA